MDQRKIGKFIAQMRKRQNYTQREFAALLGISDKTVSKWETGSGMPEVSLMLPVCEALHINLNELFSGETLTDAEYRKKAEENMMHLVKETEAMKKNIVGGQVMGQACPMEPDVQAAHETNTEFWDTIGSQLLGVTALPHYGGYLPGENRLNLLGDLTGKRVLEIGCGNGRSLQYMAQRGAAELWGIDISRKQIARTREFLDSQGREAHLICSPMEDECGLAPESFDLVCSVYGIGWTTDLNQTFRRIYSYLKKDGIFVFSWSHPIHKCVSQEEGRLIFGNSYYDEDWYSAAMGDKEIVLSNRMLSIYLNALADNGFYIEKLVEETDREAARNARDDFGRKAMMLSVAFVLRARKR